jgi:hypothetical protein
MLSADVWKWRRQSDNLLDPRKTTFILHLEAEIPVALPAFDDLPFDKRPDLSPYLIHLTKNTKDTDDCSAHHNLVSILQTG